MVHCISVPGPAASRPYLDGKTHHGIYTLPELPFVCGQNELFRCEPTEGDNCQQQGMALVVITLTNIGECFTLQKLFNAKYFYAKYYDSKIYGNMKNMCHAHIDS